ncbi:MAG: amidohydrolase family protein [Gemmatimonadaceae bacterium]
MIGVARSGWRVVRSVSGPVVASILLCAQHATLCAQRPAPIAIRNATVLTMKGPALRNATVLLRDGKIAAVGTNITIPNDARVVDGSGKYVMPGLIDAMTYFGIDAQDLAEASDPITPELRIIDAYDPSGNGFVGGAGPLRAQELLIGGVTAQYVGPGDATIVSGQGAIVKTAGASLADITVREPAAMDMSVGAGPAKTFRAKNRTPSTHPAVMALLRQSLIRAQEYDRTWQTYARADSTRSRGAAPKHDPGLDALVRVLHREMPARIQANTVTDIRGAMRLAEEFGFELIINGGAQAYQMKGELAAKKIPVVLGPISHPFISGEEIPDLNEYPAPDERNAAWLHQAGVPIAIASYSHGLGGLAQPITGKWLLIDAALAQGYGLPEDEVLRAVTLYPAQILGVANRLGSLEAGKDADVIVLDGPPLSMKTWVESVYVGGELVYSRAGGAVLAGQPR